MEKHAKKIQENEDAVKLMYANGKVLKEADYYTFLCPHCGHIIQVGEKDIACTIFRHGNLKPNGQAIPPHASRAQCEAYIASGQLSLGCAKPYRFDGTRVSICDYI